MEAKESENSFIKQLEKFKPLPENEYNPSCTSVIEYAYNEDVNFMNRMQMEDSHFCLDKKPDDKSGIFCVLDGHGGKDTLNLCKKLLPEIFIKHYNELKEKNEKTINNMINEVFKLVDLEIEKSPETTKNADDTGATCCFCFITKIGDKKKIFLANLGDTRAVLCVNGKEERISTDHKAICPEEQKRIKDKGGFFLKNRVAGVLAVTRAFGDFSVKKDPEGGVISEPSIKVKDVDPTCKYIIIASDGL